MRPERGVDLLLRGRSSALYHPHRAVADDGPDARAFFEVDDIPGTREVAARDRDECRQPVSADAGAAQRDTPPCSYPPVRPRIVDGFRRAADIPKGPRPPVARSE